MKDWKMWAPVQTKEQREVADNLTQSEKEEATKLAKELGKKAGIFSFPSLLIICVLYECTSLSSNAKFLISLSVFILNYLLFLIFIGLPIRKRQKALLNNSKYAREKRLTV